MLRVDVGGATGSGLRAAPAVGGGGAANVQLTATETRARGGVGDCGVLAVGGGAPMTM